MRDELRDAVGGVYRAFADYARPGFFEGCACCWDGEPLDAGRGRNGRGSVRVVAPGGDAALTAVPADALANVAAEVPLTAGSLDVLKHYLPRILELSADEAPRWPGIEIVFSRLNDGPEVGSSPWTQWPEQERAALQRFFHALWLDRIEGIDGDSGHRVDDVLCANGTVDPSNDWNHTTWSASKSAAAKANLRALIALNSDDLANGDLSNPFWDAPPPAHANKAAVVRWAQDRQRELADTAR
jgi:hypothetical protein